VAQDRASELGEEALDEVEPGAVFGREGELEAVRRLSGEPSLGRIMPRSEPLYWATQSCLPPDFPRDPRMGRKSGHFAHSDLSLASGPADVEGQIAESLQPYSEIFPFCGDYRRRLVRSPPRESSGASILRGRHFYRTGQPLVSQVARGL
jgi:hypothetical protein